MSGKVVEDGEETEEKKQMLPLNRIQSQWSRMEDVQDGDEREVVNEESRKSAGQSGTTISQN